jgi:RNA polymerase sigma-70 factor (ECF subfamily)
VREESSFETAVEPFRRELHIHCYRLLGGLAEADDLVQETLLRAWRHRNDVRDLGALRGWLLRIATNACLDHLRRRRPRLSPWTDGADPEAEWVEPYPDALVDGLADPAGAYSLRESVGLAFAAALQLLTPRQRATLILRDVLDWRAAEVADLLDSSESAVESTLARARGVIARSTPPAQAALDEDASALLARYVAAWEAADVDGIVALLRDDARYGMPPLPLAFSGRAAIAGGLASAVFGAGARFRLRTTSAGGRAAVAVYASANGSWEAQVLQVLDVAGGEIADVVAYLRPDLVARTGLPARLEGVAS